MNWESILTTIGSMGGVLALWEVVKYLLNRKSNMRIIQSEADKKETEADTDEFHLYKERIEELHKSNVELSTQNLEVLKAGARKDEIIEDKTAKIRELNEELLEATRKNGNLEKAVLYYQAWHCKREYGNGKGDCRRREPQQNPPLKYTPLEHDEMAHTDR